MTAIVPFLISDFCLGNDFDLSLGELSKKLQITNKHHDLISLIITDPRERELPDVGLITIEDAESGQQIELDTANPSVRQGYLAIADDRRQRLQHTIGSSGVDLLELSTDTGYLSPLLGFFRARQRRIRR